MKKITSLKGLKVYHIKIDTEVSANTKKKRNKEKKKKGGNKKV